MTLSQDPPIRCNLSKGSVLSKSALGFSPLGAQPEAFKIPGTPCLVRRQVALSGLTSFKVGGPAELYVAPRTIEELQASYAWADDHSVPLTLLGGGTNLLVSDRGIPGLVLSTRYLRTKQFDEEAGSMTVGAGVSIARLAWQAAERGWRGLEWAVGVPGTVGGSVVMNAGAHRSCVADTLASLQVLEPDGQLSVLFPEDLGYSYRTSNLQGDRRLVVQATFHLSPGGNPEEVSDETGRLLAYRRSTQPYHLPSCGSVFRNPSPTHSAGWLIEQSGLKGHQVGQAQVAERHANFILNCGGATAEDILTLIRHVQSEVEHRWSMWLHPEVKLIGEFQSF